MKIWFLVASSLLMKKWYEIEKRKAWHELQIRKDDLARENDQIKWINRGGVHVVLSRQESR